MALIMYLNRAPRHENVTAKDIVMLEDYFAWQNAKNSGSKYGSDTFEKWCGIPDSELPDMEIIKYYEPFYTKKTMWVKGFGEEDAFSIFEQVACFGKTNQLFRWFIENVMNGEINRDKFYEVTKDQLESLLAACKKVIGSFTKININEYKINEKVAASTLPLLEERGMFFGPDTYNEDYARQVNEAISVLREIIATTDFENQIIYFNVNW